MFPKHLASLYPYILKKCSRFYTQWAHFNLVRIITELTTEKIQKYKSLEVNQIPVELLNSRWGNTLR